MGEGGQIQEGKGPEYPKTRPEHMVGYSNRVGLNPWEIRGTATTPLIIPDVIIVVRIFR